MLRRLQSEAQTSNAAADHDEIVFLHASRMLSIKRVLPKKTASARNEFGLTTSIGCKFSESKNSKWSIRPSDPPPIVVHIRSKIFFADSSPVFARSAPASSARRKTVA